MNKEEIENKAKYVIAHTLTLARFRLVKNPEWYNVSDEEHDEVVKEIDRLCQQIYDGLGIKPYND